MNLIKVAETQFINITSLDGDEQLLNTNYTVETKCLLEKEAEKANHHKVISFTPTQHFLVLPFIKVTSTNNLFTFLLEAKWVILQHVF